MWLIVAGFGSAWAGEAPVELALQAESMRLEAGVLWVEAGEIVDDEGVLSFASGQIEMSSGELDFRTVQIAFESGWFLRAERMSGVLNGLSQLEGASVTACDCDCPVWALEASTLRLTGPDTAELVGASFSMGRFSLPLPDGEVSLAPKRFGVGLPGLGWELGEAQVDLPLVFRFRPDAALEIRPGWWRGPRLTGRLSVADHTEVTAGVEWGSGFSAISQFRHAQTGANWGTAARGLWVDRAASLARSNDYLTRQLPFREQVGRAWVGDFRAEAWLWQGASSGEKLQLAWVNPFVAVGPLLGDSEIATGFWNGHWRSEARAGLGAMESVGPLEIHMQSEVRAVDVDLLAQQVEASSLVEAGLVLWSQQGSWRHELRLGAKAVHTARIADGLAAYPEVEAIQPLGPILSGYGPQVQAQWWGPGQVRLDAWVPVSDYAGSLAAGSAWSVSGQFQNGSRNLAFQSKAQGEEGLHGLSLNQTSERKSLWLGIYGQGVRAEDLAPVFHAGGRFGFPLRESVLWPSASVLVVEQDVAALNAGVRLESDCACFLVGLALGWAQDRDEVTVGIDFDLLPEGN
jgi:hypothetical protein